MSVDQENDPITMKWLEHVVRGFTAVSNGSVGGVRAEDFNVLVNRLETGKFLVTITAHDTDLLVSGSIRTRTQFIRMAAFVGLPLRGVCTS